MEEDQTKYDLTTLFKQVAINAAVYKAAAQALFTLYSALIRAGFTKSEALKMVEIMVMTAAARNTKENNNINDTQEDKK